MSCPLIVLAMATLTNQSEQILTQRGAIYQRASGIPDSIRAPFWQYRLYSANNPAIGAPYWGIVEGNSYRSALDTLVRLRKQQFTWWNWLGKVGRPEPMQFTAFNALGPIALMDDAAVSTSWANLGPGAAREVVARKRRLDAARAVEESLYRLFEEKEWESTFEQDMFHNAGLNLYQAPWVGIAMTRLRTFEAAMRSAYPISISAANSDLQAFRTIAQHLDQSADQLAKKPPAASELAVTSNADAISLLNDKLGSYPVQAGEGGASSTSGTMSFKFTETGFELAQAPAGWYGGIEPVSFSSLDSITVRYDPMFGGEQRGGLVFRPKDNLRAGFRGPSGILLPLGTQPRDAELLAQALRRLVRAANKSDVAAAVKPGALVTGPDAITESLADKLRVVATGLATLGEMMFRNEEIGGRAPAPLLAAVAKRDRLWRDSEIGSVLAAQGGKTASYSFNGTPTTYFAMVTRLGVPMNMVPIDPPTWRISRVNTQGGLTNIVVREACQAQVKKSGQVVTVYRVLQETWAGAATHPQLRGMKLISAGSVSAAIPSSATALAKRFFKLGSGYLEKNRLPEAERSLRRAVSMRPDWATAWNWLGVSIVRQGRVDDAAPFCEQSILLNPKYVLGLTNLADIRRVQNKLPDSLSLAQRAATLAPKDPWAHVVLGHAQFASGNFTESEKEYRSSLELEPSNGETHADLAGALLRENKNADATAEASRALELGCRTHWVYKELALPKS